MLDQEYMLDLQFSLPLVVFKEAVNEGNQLLGEGVSKSIPLQSQDVVHQFRNTDDHSYMYANISVAGLQRVLQNTRGGGSRRGHQLPLA